MIIKNGKVFEENGSFKEKELYINEDLIATNHLGEVIDAKGAYVVPGLIDIHFHGCVGYDFCDGTTEALAKIAKYQLSNGVTSICPASMTFKEEKLTSIFSNAANYKNDKGAELIGINMEGPFISKEKKGAQNANYIIPPNIDMFYRLQQKAGGLIKLVDIAPETKGAMEFIKKVSKDIVVSLAHTTADYDTSIKAFEAGANHVTHLYNAMPSFSHREPGVIGAASDTPKAYIELITDGVHSHPCTVRATFKIFGDDRIVIISDSMMATGLKDGSYTLGGQDVTVNGNKATLTKEGNIAGSVTNLMDCIRTLVVKMNIPLESAIKCTTVNPAKAIGVYDKYGSLSPGKKANLLFLDEDLNILKIIQNGKVV